MKILHGLALIALLGLTPSVPEASAAERGMMDVVVAARFCTATGFGACGFAISSTISSNGRAGGGMLLGAVDSAAGEVLSHHIVLTARKGEVGANRAGAFVEFEGRGYMESDGEVVATDKHASWYVMENGEFAVMVGRHVFTGRSTDLGLTFASEPERGSGDTRTHEVGHWLSWGRTFGPDGEFDLIVAAPELEGYPEVAGNFRDTAEGDTAHAHGHLEFLKKVGDPATGRPWGPDTSFEANGFAAFHFADGSETEAEFFVETDAGSRELTFDVPALEVRTIFPYRVLPCLRACKRTLFHAPAAGDSAR